MELRDETFSNEIYADNKSVKENVRRNLSPSLYINDSGFGESSIVLNINFFNMIDSLYITAKYIFFSSGKK